MKYTKDYPNCKDEFKEMWIAEYPTNIVCPLKYDYKKRVKDGWFSHKIVTKTNEGFMTLNEDINYKNDGDYVAEVIDLNLSILKLKKYDFNYNLSETETFFDTNYYYNQKITITDYDYSQINKIHNMISSCRSQVYVIIVKLDDDYYIGGICDGFIINHSFNDYSINCIFESTENLPFLKLNDDCVNKIKTL